MGGSRMAGSRMGESRMAGSRMGGSKMAGAQMGQGSRMGGPRMGGSMMQGQSMMPLMQPRVQTANIPIPGNPTKSIMNEDEMTVEGVRFVEKKTLKIEGNTTYIT